MNIIKLDKSFLMKNSYFKLEKFNIETFSQYTLYISIIQSYMICIIKYLFYRFMIMKYTFQYNGVL